MGFSFVMFHGDRGLIIFSVRKRCTVAHPISTVSLARQGAQALMVMVMLFNHGREEEPLSSERLMLLRSPQWFQV